MAGDTKSVRVVANASRKNVPTFNIKTAAHPQKEWPKFLQITAAQAAANPGKFETIQDSGGTIAGLPTCYITGYTAPN